MPIGSIKSQFRDLKLQQMDAQLAPWKEAHLSARPASGWVCAIREALGMSHAGVRKLEAAEASDAITLASLLQHWAVNFTMPWYRERICHNNCTIVLSLLRRNDYALLHIPWP